MADDTLDFEAALAEEFADRGLTEHDESEETTPDESEVEAQPETEAGAEAPADDKPRDPATGQFVKAEPERPAWLPEKFKTEEDFARSYAELEQRLGQTSGEREELNRLRQTVDQLAQAEQRRSQAPADWDNLIDDNPAYAAKLAYQQGNQAAWQAAAQAWDDLAPGAPELYVQNQQLHQYVQQLGQQVQQQFQPVHEDVQTREFARAINEIATAHPDFDKYSSQIAGAAETTPEVVSILQNGSYDAKKRVVESLYWIARGRASDNLADAAQEAAQQQTDEARARKIGASVASASTTPATPAGDAVSRFTDSIIAAANEL